MDSCVATLGDMVALLLAEANRYFIMACEWLEIIKIIDTMGIGMHIISYACIVSFTLLTFYVWRMTRNRIPV